MQKTGKITVLCILMFKFLDRRRKDTVWSNSVLYFGTYCDVLSSHCSTLRCSAAFHASSQISLSHLWTKDPHIFSLLSYTQPLVL